MPRSPLQPCLNLCWQKLSWMWHVCSRAEGRCLKVINECKNHVNNFVTWQIEDNCRAPRALSSSPLKPLCQIFNTDALCEENVMQLWETVITDHVLQMQEKLLVLHSFKRKSNSSTLSSQLYPNLFFPQDIYSFTLLCHQAHVCMTLFQ